MKEKIDWEAVEDWSDITDAQLGEEVARRLEDINARSARAAGMVRMDYDREKGDHSRTYARLEEARSQLRSEQAWRSVVVGLLLLSGFAAWAIHFLLRWWKS